MGRLFDRCLPAARTNDCSLLYRVRAYTFLEASENSQVRSLRKTSGYSQVLPTPIRLARVPLGGFGGKKRWGNQLDDYSIEWALSFPFPAVTENYNASVENHDCFLLWPLKTRYDVIIALILRTDDPFFSGRRSHEAARVEDEGDGVYPSHTNTMRGQVRHAHRMVPAVAVDLSSQPARCRKRITTPAWC